MHAVQTGLSDLFSKTQQWPRPVFVIGVAIFSWLASVFFFAPHLWLWRTPTPGSFEWTRGLSLLHQIANPFATDIEPALQWRLLPTAVARLFGLQGWGVFAMGWAGSIALLIGVAHGMLYWTQSRPIASAATLAVASSSAVFVSTGWLGLNDAWAWLALAAITLGKTRASLWPASLLGPWIDERFIIALPLAYWTRGLVNRNRASRREMVTMFCCLAPYFALRAAALLKGAEAGDVAFFAASLSGSSSWISNLPLGLWMAWRACWIWPLGLFVFFWQHRQTSNMSIGGSLMLLTIITGAVLAADLSRSGAMLLPVFLAAMVRLCSPESKWSDWAMPVCVANFLVPAAHVVGTKLAPVHPLPIELWRLWHN